ncbi:undecaprenyl-diphosphatase [Geobacter pickeringii]|uniref:undecaprenyl-diphosphatase n=1 Tax=Geobacter pickeringii TaxID=345632 RepID=UPI00068C4E65|nr:undecaprenyl-diphosphatase [Geobacter pickeringii]
MESINVHLFHALNAGAGLAGLPLALATFLAEYLIGIVPLLLVLLWFRNRSETERTRLLHAFFSALLAVGINQVIGLFYQHPRPFTAGLGHTYLHHAADSSFPSDHVTVIGAVGLALLLNRTTRRAGGLLALVALPVAWARVYLGVHFPFDMIGALGTATVAVVLIRLAAHPVDAVGSRPLLKFYTSIVPARFH